MSEIGNNIKRRRLELDMSQDDLAAKLGYKSRSSINKIEIGTQDLPQSKIAAAAKALETTPSYIMGWDESITTVAEIRTIPVLAVVPAGVPISAISDVIGYEKLNSREFPEDRSYFALRVRGDSMYPKYMEGDVVIVEESCDADSGRDVIAYVNGYDATIKQIIKHADGSVELRPYNTIYSPKRYYADESDPEPVKIAGIVREIRRRL